MITNPLNPSSGDEKFKPEGNVNVVITSGSKIVLSDKLKRNTAQTGAYPIIPALLIGAMYAKSRNS